MTKESLEQRALRIAREIFEVEEIGEFPELFVEFARRLTAEQGEPVTQNMVMVEFAAIDRIMRDCEHGSRIWKECDAIARKYRLAASKEPTAPPQDALDAKRGRWMLSHSEWQRHAADDRDPGYAFMCIRLPYDADLSCRAMRESAIDAAMEKSHDAS